MLPSVDDTIAAIATAPGLGAVGIVRVAGPACYRVADAMFRPRGARAPSALPAGRVVVGEVRDRDVVVDEALLLTFRAPHSYTGQDVVELQTHGGPAVLRSTLELCTAHGARLAKPGEFTLRAYLSGRLDLVQAESVLDLVHAQSESARRNATLGLTRTLSEQLDRIQSEITAVFGNLQAVVDYPEEGVPESDKEEPLGRALASIDRLLATTRAGELSKRGARLAIVGRPNAGKSSLLNALLGYRRSLVSEQAGTTRDYLEAPLQLDGVPVTAIDTAGIRRTPDQLEAAGVEAAQTVAAGADLVLCLIDRSRPLDDEDRALVASLADDRALLIASKVDLDAAWTDASLGHDTLPLSTVTGAGLARLRAAVVERLVGEAGAGEVWIGNERHAEALGRTRRHLERALLAPDDLAALDLEEALRALAEITGRGDVAEDTLAHIFAKFCVGK